MNLKLEDIEAETYRLGIELRPRASWVSWDSAIG